MTQVLFGEILLRFEPVFLYLEGFAQVTPI
jgi:hypothetical protein